VGVHLDPDPLLGEAEPEQEPRVGLRLEHRGLADVAAERAGERRLARDLPGEGVGRVRVVRGHLEGELPAGRQQGGEPGEQRGVVGHPVERGVREHHVPAVLGERGEVPGAEGEAAACPRRGLREHRGGGVDPHRLARRERLVGDAGQLPGAAAEVDDARPPPAPDERHEIVERCRPFVTEFSVLLGVPDVAGRGQSR